MSTDHNVNNRTRPSRWDLPASIRDGADASSVAYCRRIAHRYNEAKYATLAILGAVNLYLWYGFVTGTAEFEGGSVMRAFLIIVPWLAIAISLSVVFHRRSKHFIRLAQHFEHSSDDGSQP